MSETSSRPAYKRSAKNYLLDAHFQLKYTGFLVLIAVALTGVLGSLLARSTAATLEQTRKTVDEGKETVKQGQLAVLQGQATVDRGEEVLKQSNKLSQVVSSQIEVCYGDNTELLASFKASAKEDEARLIAEQEKLTADKVKLERQASDLEARANRIQAFAEAEEHRQQREFRILAGVLVLLVLAIAVAGIVFTHRIAGPVYKMKRLFRQLGEGKLVLREKLRKGDELQHFFEAFENMVGAMQTRQQEEIDRLTRAIEQIPATDEASEGLSALKALRAEMDDHIRP